MVYCSSKGSLVVISEPNLALFYCKTASIIIRQLMHFADKWRFVIYVTAIRSKQKKDQHLTAVKQPERTTFTWHSSCASLFST